MRFIPFFIFTTIGFANAQNLVTNGSFELYSSCPTSVEQIQLATGWSVVHNTGLASPDYYNACNQGAFVGVPNNGVGYQHAYDGNAYSGIATYYGVLPNFREYIQTHLNSPLLAGHSYFVSFMTSRAEGHGMASNNLGAVLSSSPLEGNGTYATINELPQLNNTSVITNENAWTEISGTYVALGGEEYLTIGNFFEDDQTTILEMETTTLAAYYLIDYVSVTPVNLGINTVSQNSFTVYPNPFETEIQIDSPFINKIDTIRIVSALGQMMNVFPEQGKINLSALSSGIYNLILSTSEGEIVRKRIIKL